MNNQVFLKKILNSSDEDLVIYAKECNECASTGVWNTNGKIYSLLCEHEEWFGEFVPAMEIIINVALEFMKRNAKL